MVDPLYQVKVSKEGFHGFVEDIEQGKVTKERLYRVRYGDGDLEHFTSEQVQAALRAQGGAVEGSHFSANRI